MRIIFVHAATEVEAAFSSFVRCWLLTSSKVGPHCEAVAPTRLKVCKSCQYVFRAEFDQQCITTATSVLLCSLEGEQACYKSQTENLLCYLSMLSQG